MREVIRRNCFKQTRLWIPGGCHQILLKAWGVEIMNSWTRYVFGARSRRNAAKSIPASHVGDILTSTVSAISVDWPSWTMAEARCCTVCWEHHMRPRPHLESTPFTIHLGPTATLCWCQPAKRCCWLAVGVGLLLETH